jgi:hypothetical protein
VTHESGRLSAREMMEARNMMRKVRKDMDFGGGCGPGLDFKSYEIG